MKKLKDILRLKYGAKLTHRQIAKSLSVSPSVVSTYTNRAAQLGILHWPLEDKWTESALTNAFLKTHVKPKKNTLPNWVEVQLELKHKHVTLQLLWEEYVEINPGRHYSYNHYCRMYKAWLALQRPSMRQTHLAGEKLFVDYCGTTIGVVSRATGEIRQAQVFVAVLGASNYTYAEATWSQQLEDWCMSHARCFSFLEGAPQLLIPDNLRSAVDKPHRYEPKLNATYQQMAMHYNTAVVPARPRKPKDKAKAENGVLLVERWIMARLRHETFYSLRQLNDRILGLLHRLNSKKMRLYERSRSALFTQLDKPALQALPQQPYQFVRIKQARVHIDYHVEVEKHYYSVPHALLKQQVTVHMTDQLVTLYHQDQVVAIHPRSHQKGGHTTEFTHMPTSHQQSQWSPERLQRWAENIGPNTYHFIRQVLAKRRFPEQSYRTCLGVLNLTKQYDKTRVDAACERALHLQKLKMKTVKHLLDMGMDKLPLPTTEDPKFTNRHHANIRGKHYYN